MTTPVEPCAHIKLRFRLYDEHKAVCQDCTSGALCKVGINMLDEACCSITAHREVETVVMDESTNPQLPISFTLEQRE